MAAFRYQALTAEGERRKGVIESDSLASARQSLREQGLFPTEVQSLARHSSTGKRGRALARGELTLVLRELATLSRAGLPLDEALGALAEQGGSARARERLAQLRTRVREGESLASAMQRFPADFPAMVSAAVAAGEASGQLDAVLSRLAGFAERREALGRDLWLAMLYPLIVALIALLIAAGLMVYVVPRVVDVFERGGQQLPWLTEALISISDLFSNSGIFILVGVLLAVVLGFVLLRQSGVRKRIAAAWLRTPLIGRLQRSADGARLAQTLAMLLASGVPLVDALKVASRVVRNPSLSMAVDDVAARVREGDSLSAALRRTPVFPPVSQRLIESGEQSGELAVMLERVAELQEQQVRTAMSVLVAVLQPALIIIVGLFVLLIVLAILLPIFNLNSMVG